MENIGKKLVRNIKSRRYEVMEGINAPERIETLQVERFSPDSHHPQYNQYNNNGSMRSNRSNNFNTTSSKNLNSSYKVREPGSELEMTAAVSGVVPDGTFRDLINNATGNLPFWKASL
jgi:hypothetical protein